MSNIAVRMPGEVAHTILGQSSGRIRSGGKIRAGIKVLTKAAARNEDVKRIYDEGVAKGLAFDDIEKQIKNAFPTLPGTPLVPKNPPFFTVRPGDFANPKVAEQLLKVHGEDRGDGLRLYRFPVVFPSDRWQDVLPHSLRVWGSSGLKFWAEYSEDGTQRHCMRYAAPAQAGNGKVVRLFGGRRTEARCACVPEECAEYQGRQCNLQGSLIVYVPGVESVLPLEIATQSFYGMSDMINTMRNVAFMRGGRISGVLDRDGRTFYLTKQLKTVTHIDDAGQPARVDHWLMTLEAPIDVVALLRAQDDETLRLTADEAASVLSVGSVERVEPATQVEAANAAGGSEGAGLVRDAQPGAQPAAQSPAATIEPTGQDAGAQATKRRLDAEPRKEASRSPAAEATVGGGAAGDGAAAPAVSTVGGGPLQHLHTMLAEMEVGVDEFDGYAKRKWGQGWTKNPAGVNRAAAFVESHAGDHGALKHKIAQDKNFS